MLYIMLSIAGGIFGISWLTKQLISCSRAIKIKKWRRRIKLGQNCYKMGAAKEGGIFGTVIKIDPTEVILQTRRGAFFNVLISDLCPVNIDQLDKKKLAKIRYYLSDYNI